MSEIRAENTADLKALRDAARTAVGGTFTSVGGVGGGKIEYNT